MKNQNERWYRNNRDRELARAARERAKKKVKPKVRHASDEELLSGVRRLSMDEDDGVTSV